MIKNLHQLNLILKLQCFVFYTCNIQRQDEKKNVIKLFSKTVSSPQKCIHINPHSQFNIRISLPYFACERWACSGCYSILFSLCQSSALMTVCTLGHISHKWNFGKLFQCSLCKCGHKTGQFQVGVGDMAKIYQHFMILSRFFVMLVFTICLSSMARLISLL